MKNKLVGIYKITNPKKCIYIGQSYDIMKRWGQYFSLRNVSGQPRLFNSLKKYGAINHNFEILCICEHEKLNELEIYFIQLFQSFNTKKGMNLKSGGNNTKFSDETIVKMKKAHTGVKLSEHHRAMQSAGRKGNKHYLFGKHRSEETKQKIREARLKQPCPRTGKTHSEETKETIRIKKTGTILTQEHKDKISKGLRRHYNISDELLKENLVPIVYKNELVES